MGRRNGIRILNNNFKKIDLSNNKNIQTLVLDFNNFSAIDIKNNTKTEYLDISFNPCTEFYFTTLKNLKILTCESTKLTKLDLSEATKLGGIWDSAFPNANINEVKMPVSQRIEVSSGLSIDMVVQNQMKLYAGTLGNEGSQNFLNTHPVTTQFAVWGNTLRSGSTTDGNDGQTNGNTIINNSTVRTVDLSQLGVPAGNTTSATANGILANTPANMYCGNYFPSNSGNWNTVSLSGNFNTTSALTNGIFDTAAFGTLQNNWSTIQFGHQVYDGANSGSAVNAAINLANIMNNFGGLYYTPGTTSGTMTGLVADGTAWTAPTTAGTVTGLPNGFGTIEADLTAANVITGWTAGANGTKTKTHNGITWTYTPGDSNAGTLATLEAQVLSMKVYDKTGSTVTQKVRYFSSTPTLGNANDMVNSMKKKTVKIFFNDGTGGITLS